MPVVVTARLAPRPLAASGGGACCGIPRCSRPAPRGRNGRARAGSDPIRLVTIDGLPRLIELLLDRGYEFVTVSDLMALRTATTTQI
jgi:hypothetical protein